MTEESDPLRVISLGRGCQPAYQIRRITGETAAHVFDWIITPDYALLQSIRYGLSGWFDADRLRPMDDGTIEDHFLGARFLHEFQGPGDFAEKHARHAARIAHLVARWQSLMESRQNVLFVRQHFERDDMVATADELFRSLTEAAPQLKFRILYLVEPSRFDDRSVVEGVTFRALHQTAPYDWRGDDACWDRLLAEAIDAAGGLQPRQLNAST
jgi:hypothetical protein